MLVFFLLAIPFSIPWDFQVGDTLFECDGIYWRPMHDTGPSAWRIFTDREGSCDGFDSLTSIGFVAGYWEFQFAVFRGWRPGGLNNNN